jgi:hypothetical protein
VPSACAPLPDWVDCVCVLFPGSGDWAGDDVFLISALSVLSALSGLVVNQRSSMAALFFVF